MEKNKEVITADSGKMKAFLVKVNTDIEFRKRFLKDPIEVLSLHGIILNAEAKSEVETTVKFLNKDVSEIAKLPMGYEAFLKNTGSGKKPESEHGMLIQ